MLKVNTLEPWNITSSESIPSDGQIEFCRCIGRASSWKRRLSGECNEFWTATGPFNVDNSRKAIPSTVSTDHILTKLQKKPCFRYRYDRPWWQRTLCKGSTQAIWIVVAVLLISGGIGIARIPRHKSNQADGNLAENEGKALAITNTGESSKHQFFAIRMGSACASGDILSIPRRKCFSLQF